MRAIISPSSLAGTLRVPASKSAMQRACAAAWIRGGHTNLHHFGRSQDELAALNAVRVLGMEVSEEADIIHLHKKDHHVETEMNCGESGLGARMFTPLAAITGRSITIRGEGSLLKRPLDFFDEVFPKLGVAVKSNGGYLPIEVKGPLVPANIEVDGSLSSQYLTGLIMAYVAAGANEKVIRVRDLKSRPYIDLTLSILDEFGLEGPENRQYKEFYFSKKKPLLPRSTLDYTVEGDWSGAAFLLVAGALSGPLTIRGLNLLSTQADRDITRILMDVNAAIAMEAKGIRIRPSPLRSFEVDATDCPDLFPPLAVLASACTGLSVIKGVHRLVHKESNRAQTLKEELSKMGLDIRIAGDEMQIRGTDKISGNVVSSRGDHRIAMALTVLALRADSETIIEDAQAIAKSYPDFFKDLGSIGAKIILKT